MSVIQQLNKEDFRRKMYTDVLRGRRRRSNDERPIKRLWLAVRLIKFAVDHNVDANGREQGARLPSVHSHFGSIAEVVGRLWQRQKTLPHNGVVSNVDRAGALLKILDPRQITTLGIVAPVVVVRPVPSSLDGSRCTDSTVRKCGAVVVHVFQSTAIRIEQLKKARTTFGVKVI